MNSNVELGIEAQRVMGQGTGQEVSDDVARAPGAVRDLAGAQRVADARRLNAEPEMTERPNPRLANWWLCVSAKPKIGRIGLGLDDDLRRGRSGPRRGRAVDGDDGVELAHERRQPRVDP